MEKWTKDNHKIFDNILSCFITFKLIFTICKNTHKLKKIKGVGDVGLRTYTTVCVCVFSLYNNRIYN